MSSRSLQSLGFTALLAGMLVSAACGGSAGAYRGETAAPETQQAPPRCEDDASACERELRARELELSRALGVPGREPLATGAGPDCDAARELRERICALSAAICALAERNPDKSELAAKCSDAQASCTQAREDVARGCGP